MKFQVKDRFRVIENGLEGIISATSFNSIYQETEYYVTWDSFPNKGQCSYMASEVDSMWEKIAKIKEMFKTANAGSGYISQDTHLPEGSPWINDNSDFKMPKIECDHKWVEVGFNHTKIVCKHCDVEQK